MRTFTKITALVLALVMLVPLAACSPYRLELSNERQTEVMMQTGGYDIAFEVLEFFYYNYMTVVDGGDSSVWEGPDAAVYHEKLMARAISAACELYAVFAVAKDFGIDPYGAAIEELVEEGIREVIDSYDTRREYIAQITSLHMTDTVYRLMLRSYFCQQELMEYNGGVTSVSDADLIAFCESDNVINTLCLIVYFEKSTHSWAKERAALIMQELEGTLTDDQFRSVALRLATSYNQKEMEMGTYMTLREYRRLCGDENATLAIGEITEPIFDTESFVILRGIEKNPDILEKNPEAVRACYLEYLIEEKTEELLNGKQMTAAGAALTRESFVG